MIHAERRIVRLVTTLNVNDGDDDPVAVLVRAVDAVLVTNHVRNSSSLVFGLVNSVDRLADFGAIAFVKTCPLDKV